MADMSVTMDLNAREFDARLAAIEQKVQSTSRTMAGGFDNATAGGERLIGSSHRAARSIHGFTQDLLSGANASQLMSSGIMGLERTLRIPLGALAGLAVGAVIGQKIFEAIQAAQKLRDEIHEIVNAANANPSFSTLTELESRMDKISEKAKELANPSKWTWVAEAIAHPGGWKGFKADLDADRAANKGAAKSTASGTAAKLAEEALMTQAEARGATFEVQRAKLDKEMMEKRGSLAAKNFDADSWSKVSAALNAEEKAKRKQIDDAEAAMHRKEKQTTALQALEFGGESKLVAVFKEQLEYQEKINAAKKAGDKITADELQKQKNNAAKKASLDLFGSAPAFGIHGVSNALAAVGAGSLEDRWKPGGFGSLEDRWSASAGVNSIGGKGNAKQFEAALRTTEGILKEIQKNTAQPFVNK